MALVREQHDTLGIGMHIRVSKTLFWVLTMLLVIGLVAAVVYVSERSKPPATSPEVDELSRLAKGRSDKGFPGHWYTENYERFLRPWQDKPIRIFEIGVANGGSLAMWQGYFPNASIYAIDIKESSRFENARVKTCVADQAKRDQLKQCMDQFGGQFDLMIDDGGHSMEQQQVSLGFLFSYVRPGGFYSIEDLHTSMPKIYPGYGVEPDEGNSTLNMIFGYIHSAPPKFASKYMLASELSYLDTWVETADLHLANNQGHSMMCIFKKRGPNPLLEAAAKQTNPAPQTTKSPSATATSAKPSP